MDRTDPKYSGCIRILEEELLPAMGCTEPIAISYCAALAGQVLGQLPELVLVKASGNIIKNVKSVVVPNTDGLRGIEAAAAAGIVAGDPEKKLEVISQVSPDQRKQIHQFLGAVPIKVSLADSPRIFDIIVTLTKAEDSVTVRIADYHTNIILVEKNGKVLFSRDASSDSEGDSIGDRAFLDMETVYDFAESVCLEDIKPIISRQIEYNTAIAREGISKDYGANIGSVLLSQSGGSVKERAKAYAAAASDARMNGCELPVIINSGSGNQGITVTLPIVEYAKELGASEEQLYRALVLANLTAIHLKGKIGRLSAYCGAISAGAAAGCGIAYLNGGDLCTVSHTLVNALAIASGVICDGAKSSCAAKIATGVDAGILGYEMYRQGQQFKGGDGIVKKGVENTIASVGRLGSQGMRETDRVILDIMVGS